MSFHTIQNNLDRYRGVFCSKLDYNLSRSNYENALLKQRYGLNITEEEKYSFKRIIKLERLGGINKLPSFLENNF